MKTTSLEILEKAELPPAQAHAILKVMESEMASLGDTLATKAELNGGLLALRADLNAGLASVRAEISALRAETLGIEGKLSRWVLTCILGQTAVLAGLGYFLLAHSRH